MDKIIAFLPFSVLRYSQYVFDFLLSHKIIKWRHVVAKRRLGALLPDIIDIKSRFGWISDDDL
jgi:hypothetical protein